VRTSPLSLSAQAPDEGPPQLNVEGSRHQWAMAAAFSPGSLPQVWGAATRRRAQQRPAGLLVPSVGPKMSVRKRTHTASTFVKSRYPARPGAQHRACRRLASGASQSRSARRQLASLALSESGEMAS